MSIAPRRGAVLGGQWWSGDVTVVVVVVINAPIDIIHT